MKPDQANRLKIDEEVRQRPKGAVGLIFALVAAVTAVAIFFAWPRESDSRRIMGGGKPADAKGGSAVASTNVAPVASRPSDDNSVLTVSGYIVNRERIEISPRFTGMVKWIGVTKGDTVTNGQVVVLLDDTEYRARLRETDGRMAVAKVAVEKAELAWKRTGELAKINVESKQAEDDARLAVDSAKASIKEIEGQRELLLTYIDWTIIRSPINGVVLEKLVDPNELVTPQSFGGTRGPSTALIAVAQGNDLQVEIDLNEQDLAKVYLKQECKVSPEAYPDKSYGGYVAEIAPEANRQKGTLQIKVQVRNPDKFLTPELSAKVQFLRKKEADEKPAK
ncbi:MAG: efflux transporter, family, subunit [Verrucomicrobia bacterium]|nr:efflux transporter, family, subunit [Verrucomicrobiota bacterium]